MVGENNSFIYQCTSSGSVYGNKMVGGLVGMMHHGEVVNCYSTADVTLRDNYNIGGLIGSINNAIVRNCYSSGYVDRGLGNSAGGLIGFGYSGLYPYAVEKCFWDIGSSGQTWSSGGIGKATSEMKKLSVYITACWDFVDESANGTEDIWAMCDGATLPVFVRDVEGDVCEPFITLDGSGTVFDPYKVSTVEELLSIGDDPDKWDKHFVLTDWINLESYGYANRWPNFNRIGSFDVPFTGVFDGNGLTIYGLCWRSSDVDYVGMFGYIGEGGLVRDLNITAVNVDASGGTNVGIVAGVNDGTIENCKVSGSVLGNYAVGSIVGLNLDYGTVSGCDSSGDVVGTFNYTGGIAGANYNKIENSSSRAFVSGVRKVGAIAGYNAWGVIENCYSQASPEGVMEVGGLVGRNYYGEMINCYSSGTPTADTFAGSLIGNDVNGFGVFTSCFYDSDVQGPQSGIGSAAIDPAGINGETTDNLYLASTYTGWDVTTPIWVIRDNVDYPKFVWELLPFDIAGSWDINLSDFQVLASNWQKTGFTPENAYENADFNASGQVDTEDLSLFAQAWLLGHRIQKVSCAVRLRGLGNAVNIYANDYDDEFPLDVQLLVEEAGVSPQGLTCPHTNRSYAYRGAGLGVSDPGYLVVFHDKAGNHESGRNVLFVDGQVAWLSEDEFLAAIEADNAWRATKSYLEEISPE